MSVKNKKLFKQTVEQENEDRQHKTTVEHDNLFDLPEVLKKAIFWVS